MADLKERILAITRGSQLAGLATVTEDGKPRVRYVIAVGSDDMTLRLATAANTRKVKQIARNPEVHLVCGVTDPDKDTSKLSPYVQIQGLAGFTTDEVERHTFWSERLELVFAGPDDPNYGVIIVTPYRIEYWTPGQFEYDVWEAC